jgi:hypothetical protein
LDTNPQKLEKNMNYLRKCGPAFVLTGILLIAGLASGTSASACEDTAPGQIPTPPCASAQAPDTGETSTPPEATALGQTDTPPGGELSLTEIASSVLLSIVSLF